MSTLFVWIPQPNGDYVLRAVVKETHEPVIGLDKVMILGKDETGDPHTFKQTPWALWMRTGARPWLHARFINKEQAMRSGIDVMRQIAKILDTITGDKPSKEEGQ